MKSIDKEINKDAKAQIEIEDKMRSELGYSKASIQKAKEHLKNSWLLNVKGKNYSLCCTSPTTLGKHGSGLMLYFMFIKWMAIGFSVLSLIMIPSAISNILGGEITKGERASIFDPTTLSNQNDPWYDNYTKSEST